MASNLQHEPTMEEILASIRKIISEDSGETDAKPAPSANAADEFDVLELRREDVLDDGTEKNAPTTSAAPEREDEAVASERRETPASPEPPMTGKDERSDLPGEEGFFSESARRAMNDAFAKLDALGEEPPLDAVPETALSEGASVQDVFEHAIRGAFGPAAGSYLRDHADEIVERMKPIVREWMDEHFPAILEGAVRNEVERAVRAAAHKPPRR